MQTLKRRRRARLLGPLLAVALCAIALGGLSPMRRALAADVERWTQVGLDGVVVGAVAVDPHDSLTIYAGGPSGDLHKSDDGGATWPIINDFFYIAPPEFAIDPVDSQILYAGGSKSIDGGATWIKLDINADTSFDDARIFAVSPLNHQVVYAADSYPTGVRRSVNGGASWTPLSDHYGVTAIAVGADGVAYAAARDTANTGPTEPLGIFKVSDHIAWTRIYSDSLINALAIDPARPQVIYAGSEGGGVLKSEDGGVSWAAANSGLGHLVVRALAVDPTRPKVVYAGTWEGGVYRSNDRGVSWSAINDGLSNTFISSLAVADSDPPTLYAGTYGSGVFKLPIWPSAPPEGSVYARLADVAGNPVAGARLYHNGRLVAEQDGRPRLSDALGNLIVPGGLQAGDTLVALAPQMRQQSARAGHGGLAYEVLTSNLSVGADGIRGYRVVSPAGAQPITVRPDRPLVLFNLLVSVEWDADQAYLDELGRAVRRASDYLLDLTDGQMAFGAVAIFDRKVLWNDADIQVAANNIVRPHAFVGGIVSEDRARVIRLGRRWDGSSGSAGPWDRPDGYRTIAHEFGHYGLHLYDEYFGYTRDGQGNLRDEVPVSCTGPANRSPAGDATNASAMDYQYASSELSMRGVIGLWAGSCFTTAQFQLNGASAWETMAAAYADTAKPARWWLITPADRGGIMAGPAGLPAGLLDLPRVTTEAIGAETALRRLTVYRGPGEPARGAIVALYRQDGQVFSQGFTDEAGRLEIYGAQPGDLLRVASADGELAGQATVAAATDISVTLRALSAGLAATGDIPHLRVIPEAGATADQSVLTVVLEGFGAGADPGVLVRTPAGAGFAPTLSFSPGKGSYTAQVSFSSTERGTGSIQAIGGVGNSLVRLFTTYRIQRVDNSRAQTVFSDDGNLHLHLEAGSLAGATSYVVVTPPGAIPRPLPAGLALVGDSYDITASGAAAALRRKGLLRLSFDESLAGRGAPGGLAIYRWDAAAARWAKVAGDLDGEHRAVSSAVTALGTYALLAPAGELSGSRVSLPLIVR